MQPDTFVDIPAARPSIASYVELALIYNVRTDSYHQATAIFSVRNGLYKTIRNRLTTKLASRSKFVRSKIEANLFMFVVGMKQISCTFFPVASNEKMTLRYTLL